MSITEADADKAAMLAALHKVCFEKCWDAGTLSALLQQPPVFALASLEGFILARAAGGESEILTLAVVPDARRKGLGSHLVNLAAKRAQTMQAQSMFLEVGEANRAARGLYEGLGFSQVGVRKGYYAGGENALVLRAGLPLSPLGKTG